MSVCVLTLLIHGSTAVGIVRMSVCVLTMLIHGWMKVKATTERFEFHVFIPPWKPRAWTSTRSGQGACRGAGKRMRGFGEPGCEQCSQQGVNPGSRALEFVINLAREAYAKHRHAKAKELIDLLT